jgi:SUMO ligase MMS21 Smc5/6 complex component
MNFYLTIIIFVSSVACGHTYSLDAIKMLANKNTLIKCPVSGCASDVRIKQLVPDDVLLRKMKRKQPNQSQSHSQSN